MPPDTRQLAAVKKSAKKNAAPAEDSQAIRARLRHQHRLPCGARECVHCHKGCGVAMAANLSGLEDHEIPQPAVKPKPSTTER